MLAQHGHGRVEIVRLYAVHDPLVLVDESWHGMNDQAEATRPPTHEARVKAFGSEDKLPEKQVPKHLAIQINQAFHDLFAKYPETLLFG